MKKLLSTIMALVMLLSLVPMAVAEGGAEGGAVPSNSVYEVTDAAELVWVAENYTGVVKLMNDVEIEDTVIVTKTITLDMNGKRLFNTKDIWKHPGNDVEGPRSWSLVSVRENGNLTITGNGTFDAKENDVYAIDLFNKGTRCTIEDGTFIGNVHAVYVQYGMLLVNGGTFSVRQVYSTQKPYEFTLNCLDASFKDGSAQIIVNGGSFYKYNPAKSISENPAAAFSRCGVVQSGDYYKVTAPVAMIGEKGYATLAAAVEDVPTDGTETTITLLNNAEVENCIAINDGKNIVLDLNGHDVVHNGNYLFDVYNAKFHVTGEGTLFEKVKDGYAPIIARGSATDTANYTVITIDKGVTLKGDYTGIFVAKDAGNGYHNYGLVINMFGTIDMGAVADGYHYSGMYVNGTNTVSDGNVMTINLDGATIKNCAGAGIYAAGYAKWNITNSSITGGNTGIEIRAGELKVNGATVVGNGVPTVVTPNGNGSTTEGAGIAVAQHTTKLPIKVTINSGDISGFSALYQSNPQNNDAESVKKVSVAVNGGTFKAINGGTVSVYSENNCVAVSRGTFSSNPSAYVADKSLEVSKDTAGQYTVSKKTNATETSEVKLPAARTEGTTKAEIDKGDIDTGKDLTVSSEVASVTINQKGVEAIGNNSDLTLTVKTVDQPNDANKAAYDEAIKGNDTASAIVVDIKLSAGSGNAFTQAVEGAYALVTVKYDASGKADKLKVFYLNGSVKQELTKVNDAANGEVNMFSYDDTNKEITMKLPHFSQYLITTTATTSGGNTSGGNSVIKTGAGSSAASGTHTVTTDLTPGSITKVTVDGKVVDAKYYTVSGSNVTFTAEFLKTLKNGSHTVTVENATKIAKGVFTVNNPTTAVQAPTTADAGIALYAGMAIASVMGTGVVFTSRKRKNH